MKPQKRWNGPPLGLWVLLACRLAAETTAPPREIVVTRDTVLQRDAVLSARIVVRASHIVLDGNGATLAGPGKVGDPASLETAGIGVFLDGVKDVTITNLHARGFATGLVLRQTEAVRVVDCDFSDNYHNPKFGWGDLPPRGGIRLESSRWCVLAKNRANRVWDALNLVDSDDNLIEDNDFAECSNTCAKLWHASRNRFLRNRLAYGIRIDRAAGEVHARDSTCVLLETGSNDNYWYRNDITHGGDGVFIRPLNRWLSTGNVFVENDTSYANNNCVESWSPGNVFIRNRANHGSYGFWLGGSDHTMLIGNEAAYNGLPDGYHQAPEPGFGHGGIVIVGGASSHTRIEGNYAHHNHGAGIAFRGDSGSQGARWKTEHWIVQGNRLESNRFGLWGRWADGIWLANNRSAGNSESDYLTNVSNLVRLEGGESLAGSLNVSIAGPTRLAAGEIGRFTASGLDAGASLKCVWLLDGSIAEGASFERPFDRPGYYRLGLTVQDQGSAALAWRDLYVVKAPGEELGTEGGADRWGFELENNQNGQGRIVFEPAEESLAGRASLRFSPRPYPGAYATAVYPASRDAHWDFSAKHSLSFWIKALNPNNPGWQDAGPVLHLIGPKGRFTLKPARDANWLNDPPFNEARELWMPIVVPLRGDKDWLRTAQGEVSLDRIDAIGISLDSFGYDPFAVWLDGLTVE